MENTVPQPTKNPPPLRRRNGRLTTRDYVGPLGILAAGAIGLSLLCSVSAMAMGDLNRYVAVTLAPLNLIDLAVSNLETAAALTEQVVTVFVPTETLTPTSTSTLTPLPTDTVTITPRRFVTITPTQTRRPREALTATRIPTRIPSRTPTRVPTRTPTRTPTQVPPTATRTPIPPTDTLVPTSTFTELPPTPVDTATQPPPPTPVDTDTPPPVQNTLPGPVTNPSNTPGSGGGVSAPSGTPFP